MNREELGAHALATADWVSQQHYIVRLRDEASGNRKRLSRRTRREAHAHALPVVQDEHRDVQEVVVGDLERDIGGRTPQACAWGASRMSPDSEEKAKHALRPPRKGPVGPFPSNSHRSPRVASA